MPENILGLAFLVVKDLGSFLNSGLAGLFILYL